MAHGARRLAGLEICVLPTTKAYFARLRRGARKFCARLWAAGQKVKEEEEEEEEGGEREGGGFFASGAADLLVDPKLFNHLAKEP